MRRSLFVLLSLCAVVTAQTKPAVGWKLVWSDEFNTPGRPDRAKWGYERGFVRNREAQWYQPENARCDSGLLIIEARREKLPNPTYRAGSTDWKTSREFIEYTSASLMTKDLHQWQYGRFEMRGRIDTRPGMWPAFWTLGVSGEWPSNGEIDIMEYYRGTLLANAAWGTATRFRAAWNTLKKPIAEFNDPKWSEKFHVWRMDWDRDFIKLYLDDVLLNTVDLSRTINGDGSGKNPFHQPHYILLNLAIGGDNGGDPSTTVFPAKLEVEYVRIHQRQ